MDSISVAPGLLVAMPQLGDPNFERAVVLMVEHNDGGSFGIILNRPGNIPVALVLRGFEIEWTGDPMTRVGFGGPVQTESGWLVHEPIEEKPAEPGTLLVAPGIALSMSLGMLRRLAADPPERLRFFMGYAGWGPGQLADEMVQGSWLHAAATPELVFETRSDDLWPSALRSIGVDPAALLPSSGIN